MNTHLLGGVHAQGVHDVTEEVEVELALAIPIMMSWKLLIVLVLFTIALGNVNGQKAEEEAEKVEQDTGCCKEDLLVTCDGTNTGLKKEGSTEAETENACADYHSYTAQKSIFGCYKKEKKEEAKGRIWPFTSSTANAGSTAKLLTNPTQEQELWKQEKGTNGIWYKAGIYHLGEEEGKFQTMAKAMLKNTCLKAGETWNYWGDNKWYKNNGVVIKCGC